MVSWTGTGCSDRGWVAALSTLLAGVAVLLLPKGTHIPRVIGTAYVLALVLVNVGALSLHREDVFGVFHALAVASLVTVAVGLCLCFWARGRRGLSLPTRSV